MDEIIIEVKGLYKFYKAGENIVHALDGLDFTINKGEFVAIVGPHFLICLRGWKNRLRVK